MLELTEIDDSIRLDIRYARHDNFVGRPVYGEPRAFLQPVAARALIRAQNKIKPRGFGLIVFDAYRPWSVTKIFWDEVTEAQRPYVADPEIGSRHNRGCTVDLSMVSLETGVFVDMPSDFDEFVERSHPDFAGGTKQQRENRDLLRMVMETEGFTVNPKEWWHFDHRDWEQYEVLDLAFGSIPPNP